MAKLEIGKAVLTNSSEDGTYAEFVVDPLERGYGTTLGNSLRRVLLSSIPGAAASSIKIDGVTHEFSTVPGIRQDVTEIVLNVKDITVRLNNCDSKTVYIDVKGPCEFTANMIDVDSDLEILSDNLIASLDAGSNLKMEITFTSGTGYVSADQNRAIMPSVLNLIPVDSLYSPVRKVNYVVENTRVGKITDYDKLIFQVWTNGVISAQDAVSYASNSLMDHFDLFCFSDSPYSRRNSVGSFSSADSSDILLDDLGLSARAYNSLKRAGIESLNQLKNMSKEEIAGIRNLGTKSCNEIYEKLKELGCDPASHKSGELNDQNFSEIITHVMSDDDSSH